MTPPNIQGKIPDDPIAGFRLSDMDDAGDPSYYGYVNRDGAWYILRINSAEKTFRYSANRFGYTTNWTNRNYLVYDRFDVIF